MGAHRPGIFGRVAAPALAVALALVTAAPSAGASSRTGKELRAALDDVMSAPEGPPSASVLIERRGATRFIRRGVANVATGEQPTRRQRYRIASMSKAFNGAVALALVSRGKLHFDDTVGELLPGVLPLAEDVTLEQALLHTGALPDYIRDPDFITALTADPAQYMTPLELVEFVADTPPDAAPGERYEYSDTDNVIVGLMAEAVTGKSYDELLERHVYAKTGLAKTSLPSTIAMTEPYLHGYEIEAGSPPEDVSEFINPALAWASGGMVSTPDEVARFFRAYAGGELFGAKERKAQRTYVNGSSSPPGPGRNRAGLGLFRYRTKCGTVLGHTGSFPGYRLFAAASRDGRRSVVFTVNAQIVPGSGSDDVSSLIRRAQVKAVCHMLR